MINKLGCQTEYSLKELIQICKDKISPFATDLYSLLIVNPELYSGFINWRLLEPFQNINDFKITLSEPIGNYTRFRLLNLIWESCSKLYLTQAMKDIQLWRDSLNIVRLKIDSIFQQLKTCGYIYPDGTVDPTINNLIKQRNRDLVTPKIEYTPLEE